MKTNKLAGKFPVITNDLQKAFEQQYKETPEIPTICGYYGRACRKMDSPEGANTMICTDCSLAEFANEFRKVTKRVRYIGRDSWDRYVYKDENGKLWKHIDCCSPREVCIERGDTLYSSCGNSFNGEPDCPMSANIKVDYVDAE